MSRDEQIEKLSSELHDIYINEAKRQGDIRHKDKYEDLSENIKDYDRVLARFILERERKIIKETGVKMTENNPQDNELKPCPFCGGKPMIGDLDCDFFAKVIHNENCFFICQGLSTRINFGNSRTAWNTRKEA